MSQIRNEVLSANEKYVSTFGNKGSLALPPARSFAILTCMDAPRPRQVRWPYRR